MKITNTAISIFFIGYIVYLLVLKKWLWLETLWFYFRYFSILATKTLYSRNKRIPKPKTKIILNGVKLFETNQVKYVGIIFDEHLTFKTHISLLNAKLKRANNLLAISRHYLAKDLLLQIYYGQFYSHLTYGCQLWGQNENAIKQTITIQKKAIRLMSFAHFQEHSSPLFKDLNILKLEDVIKMNNILFTHNTVNKNTPVIYRKS